MSAKKPNISQIDQYLKGKLDARAMHQLERQAQDDPFLMDALQGYEQSGKDQHANLAELKERLGKRVAPAKERSIILWRVLPIAASVLVMIGTGYWFFKPEPIKQQYANVITPGKTQPQVAVSPPTKPLESRKKSVADNLAMAASPVVSMAEIPIEEPAVVRQTDVAPNTDNKQRDPRAVYSQHEGVWSIPPTYKKDTVEYLANDYKVKSNAKAEDIIKKLAGFEVGADGSITYQGQNVTKAKLNGKDFIGGDITQATRNLPADIIDKIQIVDDYGDQAAKTGIRTRDPQKVLNLTTDTINKKGLLANNRPVLREVVVTNPIESKLVGRVAGLSTTNPNLNSRQVAGTVLDDKGIPLVGATVKVDGTNNAVNTDTNGNFKIDLPSNKDLLAVNYVGYNAKQVKVGDQKDMRIALDENPSSLNEVVVVGYGMQKKKSTTGSTTSCNENLQFKKNFFAHITTVEKYTNEQLTGAEHTVQEKAFKKSLEFIGKYAKVATDKGYANIADFQADKKLWLSWYEANKCSNLK